MKRSVSENISMNKKPIRQYPCKIVAFSSQYGSEDGSYSVRQLVGTGPSVYPRYGDFCEACVLRYYGPWWSRAPSAAPVIGLQPASYPTDYCSEDFVEVEYPQPVHLQRVRVYETFIPGCLVAVFARSICFDGSSPEPVWHRVWHRSGPSREPHASRVLELTADNCCPALHPGRPVNRLRLEFNCSLAEYYTEIDTVELVGIGASSDDCAAANVLAEQMSVVSLSHPAADSAETEAVAAGWFGAWPSELLTRLLGQLDLQSLLRIGQTCRLLHHFSSDPLLYRSLSLRPHCLRVTADSLRALAIRLSACHQLDLSWCSGVSSEAFCELLPQLDGGGRLRTLRLASCSFLDDDCLKAIGAYCPALTDLDLSGCMSPRVGQSGYSALATGLSRLNRLNLYRCSIDLQSVCALIGANPHLRHVNLGASPVCVDCADQVVAALAKSCPGLLSLDFWRSRSLSCFSLSVLAEGCPHLLELDIGWCVRVDSANGCLAELAQRCRGLQKLFLTANRTIRDVDLRQIAKHCRDLRQLDILGSNHVSLEAVHFVLQSCPKLEMFDVSFCGQVNRADVEAIRASFPQCSIKMSFQNL